MKSTHQALVYPINLLPHPDPETTSLSLIKIDDYTVVGRTDDWKNQKLGIYIQPDTLVDTTKPEFSFLRNNAKYNENCEKGGSWARITAKRLRGVISYGLLIPAPNNAVIGEDYWDRLGCVRFEPPDNENNKFVTHNESCSAPNLPFNVSKYDIDSGVTWARKAFIENELVTSTLKYHGENVRFTYFDGQFWCGSRSMWKREFATPWEPSKEALVKELGEELGLKKYQELYEKFEQNKSKPPVRNQIWTLLRNCEPLQKFLIDNPNTMVYGELIGKNPGYRYDVPKGAIGLKTFDILKDGTFLDTDIARNLAPDLPWAVIVHHNIPFNIEFFLNYIENMPIVDNKDGAHEEGIVVKPKNERVHPKYGRVAYKFVTPNIWVSNRWGIPNTPVLKGNNGGGS